MLPSISNSRRPIGSVAVIIVNWNTQDLLASCLSSLQDEARHLDADVVVVDNASSDGSERMLRASFPWVHVVQAGANLGFARANNLAIAQTETEFVFLLNPDTELSSGVISTLRQALDDDPRLAAVTPRLRLPDGSDQPGVGGALPSLISFLGHYFFLGRIFPRAFTPFMISQARLVASRGQGLEWICGAAMMVRRSAIDAVGALSSAYFMYGEDIEWCTRFQRAGWSVGIVPLVAVLHHHGATSEGRGAQAETRWLEGLDRYARERWPAGKVRTAHLIAACGFALRAILYSTLVKPAKARRMLLFSRASLAMAFR